ncbi:conserved hypothetical protein [Gloeothece citriformis PCC 7424]|uniref:Phasin family protein n=1 Tax=Gloeothece citriformis (strain PCC 7424) TaxID=65393 RepID=B7KGY8_GLOC7|nr:conserved hypothetical protein [Gloeothece citriformis PCC 7424]
MTERPNIPDLGSLVQKAVYLGIGIADYAAEKARVNLKELKEQARKLADEMVARGEMNLEEARKYVDDIIQQAQQQQANEQQDNQAREPRRIEIVSDEDDSTAPTVDSAEELRKQVQALQDELRRLKKE